MKPTSADLKFNPMNPSCPGCSSTMRVNTLETGIRKEHDALYLIPIKCDQCGLEAWVQALPVGVLIEERFSKLLKKGRDQQ